MPIPFIAAAAFQGVSAIPYAGIILRVVPWLLGTYGLKVYFGGSTNSSERNMHSKVIMITVRWPRYDEQTKLMVSRAARLVLEHLLHVNLLSVELRWSC